jgi:hypothetical protein
LKNLLEGEIVAETKKNSESKKIYNCIWCGKALNTDKTAYVSKNDNNFDGKLIWCRECVNKKYVYFYHKYADVKKAVYLTCRTFNLPFLEANYAMTKKQLSEKEFIGEKFFGYYMTKCFGFHFKEGDPVWFEDGETSFIGEVNDDNFDDTAVKQRWGDGFAEFEYHYLEDELYKLKRDYECDGYIMEMHMRDIALLNLRIFNAQKTKAQDLDKLIGARSKLLTDANLKPVQSTGAEADDRRLTLGLLAKKLENERPIEADIPDGMKKYIELYTVGHLAKMHGIDNDLVRAYEEDIKQYTIDFNAALEEFGGDSSDGELSEFSDEE